MKTGSVVGDMGDSRQWDHNVLMRQGLQTEGHMGLARRQRCMRWGHSLASYLHLHTPEVVQYSHGHSLGSDLNPQLMVAALIQGAGGCGEHFVTVRYWYAGEQAFEREGVSRDFCR